jgi:Fic family protein
MPFKPKFTITPRIAISLMRIEAARQAVQHLPITPSLLASLRESSRLFSTHYSTMIEGNRLTQEQVAQVIGKQEHFPGRERDEKEVLGYYAALAKVEQFAAGTIIVTELEEYYARNLGHYYEALTIGPSHNYYMGRTEADITQWIEYFCAGTAESFEHVRKRAQEAAGSGVEDSSPWLRKLDPRQRKALELFRLSDAITSSDVAMLFTVSQRAARNLLTGWVEQGFLLVADPAKKSRKYGLANEFRGLLR